MNIILVFFFNYKNDKIICTQQLKLLWPNLLGSNIMKCKFEPEIRLQLYTFTFLIRLSIECCEYKNSI